MRRIVFSFVFAILAGCGSSPTAPSGPLPGPAPLFSTGTYLLQLNGYDFSSDPRIPACAGPIGVPREGKLVNVELQVVLEGSEWVGRGTTPDAAIELRFRDAGLSSFGRRAFAGTIKGRAPDGGLRGLTTGRDVAVVIGGSAAIVEGETAFPTSTRTLVGRAQGDIRFQDSAGNAANCSAIGVHMNAPLN